MERLQRCRENFIDGIEGSPLISNQIHLLSCSLRSNSYGLSIALQTRILSSLSIFLARIYLAHFLGDYPHSCIDPRAVIIHPRSFLILFLVMGPGSSTSYCFLFSIRYIAGFLGPGSAIPGQARYKRPGSATHSYRSVLSSDSDGAEINHPRSVAIGSRVGIIHLLPVRFLGPG